jgi:endonuclease YncB( thermonuclease family)
MRYKRTYGPLDWEYDPPRSPFAENGELIGSAYYPLIQNIIDGDSLVVRDRMGSQTGHQVRLIGVRARDYGLDDAGATEDKHRLLDALQQALTDGDSIYLVRDPDNYGNVDLYGRELAWLWIGDKPFNFPDEMLPNRDPSGGDG